MRRRAACLAGMFGAVVVAGAGAGGCVGKQAFENVLPEDAEVGGDADASVDDDGGGTAACSGPGDCDDGLPCTKDLCDPVAGCLNPPEDCSDGDACTADSCDPGSGCAHAAISCDDGLDCTGTETCSPIAGCLPGTPKQDCCSSDAHCDADQDPCNGRGQCQLATGTCLLLPAPKCDDGKLCNGLETCDPATENGCVAGVPLTCADGNACNGVEVCDNDKGCTGGVPLDCDDGLPCNGTETCDPVAGCIIGDALPGCCKAGTDCEDGNSCNGIGSCDGATETCKVEPPPKCDNGNPCDGPEACVKGLGCLPGPPLACGDGNACNGLEECEKEKGCVSGTPNVCGDGNACTGLESCHPQNGCVPGQPPACDDGNECNGVGSCDKALGCVGGTPLTCTDGNPCNGQEACEPGLGCTPGDVLSCTDGNACNGLETCDVETGCVPGEKEDCDDGDACTDDSCDPSSGCTHAKVSCDDANECTTDACAKETGCVHGGGCDDGDACTTDACGAGKICKHTQVACDDGDLCTTDTCDDVLGCQTAAVDCEDGDGCTIDTCAKATGCAHADKCEDGDPCTVDTCDEAEGCTSAAVDCSDGDACTTDTCVGGDQCLHEGVDCDDADPCTVEGCDSETGCTHDPVDCDDGDACTADSCDGGDCEGEPLDCEDGKACTTDGCDSATGCTHSSGCDDGDPCTKDDCDDATGCSTSPACVDGDACNEDLCDTETGACSHSGGCDDGDACTVDTCLGPASCDHATADCVDGDACTDDSCDPAEGCQSTELSCDDGLPCTEDACDPASGCTHAGECGECESAADCDDGFVCTDDSCTTEGACSHKNAGCDDGNPCTSDACDGDVGCIHSDGGCDDGDPCTVDACDDDGSSCAYAFVECEDGNPCTVGEVCDGGGCQPGFDKPLDLALGGGSNDEARDVVLRQQGGYAAAGYTQSKGAGGADGWLVASDPFFQPQIDQTYGKAGDDVFNALVELSDGGFALVGYSNQTGTYDAWLVRTNSGGGIGFEKIYGGSSDDFAQAVVARPNGEIAFAGQNHSKGAGGYDMWLAAVDAAGNTIFDRVYGGAGEENAFEVALLADTGFALAGDTTSKGAGGHDAWLVRTDPAGFALWDRTYGGAQDDYAHALAQLPDGGFVLAGYTQSKGAGGWDVWILRTDAQGELLWEETHGGAGTDQAYDLAPVPGGFLLLGATASKGAAGNSDAWLVRTDAVGGLVWDRTFERAAGAKDEAAFGLALFPGGGNLIAGRTGSLPSGLDLWLMLTSDGSTCGDGDACEVVECASGGCEVFDVGACDDGEPCTADSCAPETGCVHAPATNPCDDGDPCTSDDACSGGKCQGGTPGYAPGFDVTYSSADWAGRSIAALPDGGMVVGGGKTAGGWAMWLARVSPAGGLEWEKVFDFSADDYAYAVAALEDGGFALAGRSFKTTGSTEDMVLVRTDAAGNLQYDRHYGGAGHDEAFALVPLEDGFLLAGYRTDASQEGWLVRTNLAGDLQWQRAFGGAGADLFQAAVAVPDGGFAVAGYTNSKGAGGYDQWIVRTDDDGDLLWERTWGGTGDEFASAIAALPGGRLAVAGYIGSGASGVSDLGFRLLDPLGNPLWERLYGGAGEERAASVAVHPNGGFLLSGGTSSKGQGAVDIWALRTDAEGEPLWDRTFGSGKIEYAGGLALLPADPSGPWPAGGFAIVGDAWSGAEGQSQSQLRLVAAGDGAPCEGGDACTLAECVAAECIPVGEAPCDDGESCTADACDPEIGCTHAGLPDGDPCDDGDTCTGGDVCSGAICGGGLYEIEKTYGGDGDDGAESILALPGGAFALGGYTTTQPTNGGADLWLVRTDAQGNVVAELKTGGGAHDGVSDMGYLPDGGIALYGYTASKGAGQTDWWLLRTDADAKVVWDRTYGTPGDEQPAHHGLVVHPEDGYAMAGYTDAKGAGGGDMWLVRTDEDGDVVWEMTYGGTKQEYAWALATLPDGGYALAGKTESKGAGGADFWLVRTDHEGAVLWDRTYGGGLYDDAFSLTPMPEGGFALAGVTYSKGAGDGDLWLVRTDLHGDLLWDLTLGGAKYDDAYAIVPEPDGGVAIAGRTFSKGAGKQDGWILRTDAGGALLWERTRGGSNDDRLQDLVRLPTGGLALAGANPKGAGPMDMWLLVTADGRTCEGDDACVAGECFDLGCEPRGPVDCDDGEACTFDACEPEAGCTHDVLFDGEPCDEGLPCTATGRCADGVCSELAGTFDRTYGDGGYDQAQGIAALPNGYVMTGFKKPGGEGSRDVWLVRTDLAGNALWEKSHNGSANDEGRVVAAVGTGYVVAGYTNKNNGSPNVWLFGTDEDGDIVWEGVYGGGGHDDVGDMAVLADGYALAAYTTSKGAGGFDAWLVRTDAAGYIVWDRTYGAGGDDRGFAIAALADGYAMTGWTDSKGAGARDVWLVRTDLDGDVLWEETYGGAGMDYPHDIVAVPGGGFWIAAGTQSKGAGNYDAWLLRVDGAGTLLGETVHGGAGYDEAGSLELLPDGGLAVLLYRAPAGDANQDFALLRTDAAGEVLWERSWGGPANDTSYAFVPAPGGGYALAGVTESKGAGQGDFWLVVTADGAACDDGDACETDNCFDGGCESLVDVDCDDGNPCSDDSCHESLGCLHAPTEDATPCDDGDPCTLAETCTGGTCAGDDVAGELSFEKSGSEFEGGLAVTPSGDLVMAGYIATNGSCGDDGRLVRTTSEGSVVWDETYGGPAGDHLRAVVPVADGGFALGGSTFSKGAGVSDMWLVRTDASGGLVWDRAFGGEANDYASALAALQDGGFALAGYTFSKGAGAWDFWLVRTNAAGEVVWDRTYGGALDDQASSLAALPDGGYALAGFTWSKGAGTYDFWLVRTDAAGELLWDRTYGGGSGDQPFSVVTLSDGGFALVGVTLSKGAGGEDLWLVRTDADGDVVWDKTFGSAGKEIGFDLAVLPDEGFAVSGSTGLPWLLRTDAVGNEIWSRTFPAFGTTGSDATSVAVLPGGRIAFAGTGYFSGGYLEMHLVVVSDGAACEDGSACLVGECLEGACNAGPVVDCDDVNDCTADSCDPETGCGHVASGAVPCDDGDLCTEGDACSGTSCLPGALDDCNDSDPCTIDGCDPDLGCTHTPDPCDDGDPCTGDLCEEGTGCNHIELDCTPASKTWDFGNAAEVSPGPNVVLEDGVASLEPGPPAPLDEAAADAALASLHPLDVVPPALTPLAGWSFEEPDWTVAEHAVLDVKGVAHGKAVGGAAPEAGLFGQAARLAEGQTIEITSGALPPKTAFSVTAWVRIEDGKGPDRMPAVRRWPRSETLTAANFQAQDAGLTDGLETVGYSGAVFDGRYVYFVPDRDATGQHGRVLRLDSSVPYGDEGSVEAYDAQTTDGINEMKGFRGGTFDGRYVWFTYNGPEGASFARFLRFDTTGTFQDAASWDAHQVDGSAAHQRDAVYDGRFLWFLGTNTLRIDRTESLTDAWAHGIAAAPGFSGGATFDGRYLYMAAGYPPNTAVRRFDTASALGDASTGVSSSAMYFLGGTYTLLGVAFDGRYVLWAPHYDHGAVYRYDTTKDFMSVAGGGWEFRDANPTSGLDVRGYAGIVVDGRHGYFVPNHFVGVPHGRLLRYDTSKTFAAAASWEALDAGAIGGLETKGYEGGVFDGRRVHFAPHGTEAAPHGNLLAFDTIPGGGFALEAGRAQGPNPTGPAAILETTTGHFVAGTAERLGSGWHHLAMVWDTFKLRLYVDGVQEASVSTTGTPLVPDHPIELGGDGFDGLLDEVAFYGKALKATEVAQLAHPSSSPAGDTAVPAAGGAASALEPLFSQALEVREPGQGATVSPPPALAEDGLTVEAWVEVRDGHRSPAARIASTEGFWETMDASVITIHDPEGTDGLELGACDGGAFDGRYVYFAPYNDGKILRLDTTGAFEDPASWKAHEPGVVDGWSAQKYARAIFDGRYVYFIPYQNLGSVVLLRYDTTLPFTDAASWSARGFCGAPVDGIDVGALSGATFDGRYIYSAGHSKHCTNGCSGSNTCSDGVGFVRYDTTLPFGNTPGNPGLNAESWDAIELNVVDGLAIDWYTESIFDGRYVHFGPGTFALRYDTSGTFQNVASWDARSVAETDGLTTSGSYGAAFDGRYVYYAPYPGDAANSNVLRVDTRGPWLDPASWDAFNAIGIDGQATHSRIGVLFDGRMATFLPYSALPSALLRFDTWADFKAQASWNALPLGEDKYSYEGVSAGRYLFMTASDGTIMRLDTSPGGQGFTLEAARPGRSSSSSSGPVGPAAAVVTSEGRFVVGAFDTLPTGWHHLAMTWDGALLRFFVDGGLADESEAPGTLLQDPAAPLELGSLGEGYAVDEVAVWPFAVPEAVLASRLAPYPVGTTTVDVLPAAKPPKGKALGYTSFDVTATTPPGTSIGFQLSTDGGATWLAWNGSAWTAAAGLSPANDAATVAAHIAAVVPTTSGLRVRAVLTTTDPAYTPTLDAVTVGMLYLP